jgi:hypothetical protein
VSLLQTILVFVLVPAGVYALVAVLAAGRRRSASARYRPGEPWKHEPVWWTANPAGAHLPANAPPLESPATTTKGGADGVW